MTYLAPGYAGLYPIIKVKNGRSRWSLALICSYFHSEHQSEPTKEVRRGLTITAARPQVFPDELPTGDDCGAFKGSDRGGTTRPIKVLINTNLRHVNNYITFFKKVASFRFLPPPGAT